MINPTEKWPLPARRLCEDVLLTVDHAYGTIVVQRVHPIMVGTPAHLEIRYTTKPDALFLRDPISVVFQHTLDCIANETHRRVQKQELELRLLNLTGFDSIDMMKTSEFPLWLNGAWEVLDSLLLDCFEGTALPDKITAKPCPTLQQWRDTHYPRGNFLSRLLTKVFEGFGLH